MFAPNRCKIKQDSVSVPVPLDFVLRAAEDQYHCSLAEITSSAPTLLVFLRDFGCCFCRETLSDIHGMLAEIESAGAKLVLVHMSSEEEASQILATYGLADISRISSPDQSLYRTFGLGRGSLDQILAPRVIARALEALVHGNPIGIFGGDGLQMPGVFLLHHGKVLETFMPHTVATRPNYLRMVSAMVPVC